MRNAVYRCKNCGNKFEVKILDPGEAEDKHLRPTPVTCPRCKSDQLKRLK